MTENLTMKKLAAELEVLRARVVDLEQQLERKLEATLEKAATRLKDRIEARGTDEHGSGIDAELRQQMIAEAAYLIAERRGFTGGDPAQDWAEAETEVNNRLMHMDKPGNTAARRKKPAAKRVSS